MTWRGEGSLSQKCEGRTAPRQDQDARANRWMLRHEFKHKPKLGGGTSVPAVNLSFLSWGDKAQVQLPSKPFDFVHQLQLVVPYDSSEILLPVLTPTNLPLLFLFPLNIRLPKQSFSTRDPTQHLLVLITQDSAHIILRSPGFVGSSTTLPAHCLSCPPFE